MFDLVFHTIKNTFFFLPCQIKLNLLMYNFWQILMWTLKNVRMNHNFFFCRGFNNYDLIRNGQQH